MHVILQLKSLNFLNLENAVFLDTPDKKQTQKALENLIKIEALNLQGKITDYGKSLLNFPMSVLTSNCALKLFDKSEIF